jgi:hypothetical protein
MAKGPFKMKGSPMQRNFGIGSPLNNGQKTKGKLKKTLIGPIKPMTDKDGDGIPVGVDSDDNNAMSNKNKQEEAKTEVEVKTNKTKPKSKKTKSKPVKGYKTIQIDPTVKPPGFWSRS